MDGAENKVLQPYGRLIGQFFSQMKIVLDRFQLAVAINPSS